LRFVKSLILSMVWLFSGFAIAQTIVNNAIPELSPSPPGASVGFRELNDGDIVPKSLRVKFEVTGMKVRRPGKPQENSGHYHLLVDERSLPDLTQPLPNREGIYHFDKAEKSAVINMPPGEHTLQLVFADYRHIPHDPPVMSEKITVIVEEDAD